jgi:hypothetical protein
MKLMLHVVPHMVERVGSKWRMINNEASIKIRSFRRIKRTTNLDGG